MSSFTGSGACACLGRSLGAMRGVFFVVGIRFWERGTVIARFITSCGIGGGVRVAWHFDHYLSRQIESGEIS